MRAGWLAVASTALVAADEPMTPAGAATKGAVDVGNIFAQGGSFGLILYALILAVFLQFIVVIVVAILWSRDRRADRTSCQEQAKAFADASKEGASALKDAATAIASSASADMTFKQSMASMLERLELALVRFESGNGNGGRRR